MPRDGSGVYTLPAGNPVVTGTIIASPWANSTLSDIAAQLNNVFTRDGLLGPTGPFKVVDGTVNAPGLAWNSEPGLGWFRAAAGDIRMAASGAQTFDFNAAAAGTTLLSVTPRAAGNTYLALHSSPFGSANYSAVVLQCAADGSGSLSSSKGGTGGFKPMNYDATQHVFKYPENTSTVSLILSSSVHNEISMNKGAGSFVNNIVGRTGTLGRWVITVGDNGPETGGNAGSNFAIGRYNDAGVAISTPFFINRSNGVVTLDALTVNGTVTSTGNIQSNDTVTALANVRAQGQLQAGSIECGPISGTAASTFVDMKCTSGLDFEVRMLINSGERKLHFQGGGGDPVFHYQGNTAGFFCDNVSGGFGNTIAMAWTSIGLGLRVDNSQIGTINVTPPSDTRLKKDIIPLGLGLDAVMALSPIEFEYDHSVSEHFPQGLQYGFSAQEVEGVVPNAVSYVDEYRHLDQRKLIPILVKAIHDLDHKIESLVHPAGA